MAYPGERIDHLPELNAAQSIKIAPNTSVPVTDRLLVLIDSKTFQRLRQIRQLSLSDRVFPSATHTRFSHALGVYNNVLDYLRNLDRFREFRDAFEERDYLSVLLAGLLHDLGHYPCAHQLEHIHPFPKHEDLTVALIRGELRVEGEDFGALIRETFGLDPEAVTRFLGHERIEPPHALLKQFIDSPIDADKCDYLPRDSYYCGVDYGMSFDRERFIRNLVPSLDGRRLCVHEKGLMSAERLQLARYWMYRSVYWGHTVRALITMLAKACEFIDNLEDEPDWPLCLMRYNDHNFLEWLHLHAGPQGKELIELIHVGRRPYKRVFTISSHHDPDIYERLQELSARLAISRWFRRWARDHGLRLEEHHLIWDVPPTYKTDTWETFPIRLSSGEEVPVARESPVVDALSKAFLHGVRKIRLFCHPRLDALLAERRREIPVIQELLRASG